MCYQRLGLWKLSSRSITILAFQVAPNDRSHALLMFQGCNILIHLTGFRTLEREFLQFIEHELVEFVTNVRFFASRTISVLLGPIGDALFAKRGVATVALLWLVKHHLANVAWVLGFERLVSTWWWTQFITSRLVICVFYSWNFLL